MAQPIFEVLYEGFNPRPALRPGDAGRSVPGVSSTSWTCFNPRPALRPGDARGYEMREDRVKVSIRARP